MRLASMVVLGTAVAGKPVSCNQEAEHDDNVVVTFELPSGPGSAGVEVRGCRSWLGSEGEVVLPPGQSDCALVGWREDGQLRVESEPVQLASEPLFQHVVFDALPSGPIGGMGASVRKVGSAIRIERVLAGSPAEDAGLAPGDRILSVGERSTVDMSTTDFIRTFTGPPGETVAISVEDPDGTGEREIVRKRIP